jgi:hypothetical protein
VFFAGALHKSVMPPDLATVRNFFTASGPIARGTMGSDFLPHAENRAMENMHITSARKSLTQCVTAVPARIGKNLFIS